MIGILLLTHEDFGKAMLKSAELIVGDLEGAVSVGLHRGDDIMAFSDRVAQAIDTLGREKDGVLVFVDLFGASPYNAAAMASQNTKAKFRCITGLSFPMLLEALTMRDGFSLDELALDCMKIGRESVKELFQELEKV